MDSMKLSTYDLDFSGTPAEIAYQINEALIKPLVKFAGSRDTEFGAQLQAELCKLYGLQGSLELPLGYVLLPIIPDERTFARATAAYRRSQNDISITNRVNAIYAEIVSQGGSHD